MDATRWLAKCDLKFTIKSADLDIEHEGGPADSGRLETDLGALLLAVGNAAGARKTAVVLAIKELRYIPESALAAAHCSDFMVVRCPKVSQVTTNCCPVCP